MSTIGPVDRDLSENLQQTVRDAIARRAPLNLVGGGSKRFYGRAAAGEIVEVSAHRGIVSYEPTELVLTARAGTPLAEVEQLLENHRQMLGFEPPHFGPDATVGGAVATGLSGPRRPYAGSLRDALLGVRMLNGRGEILRFGGQVMKNVAGFDVSRLMAGAMGTLGLLLDVSLKVLPRPESEITLAFECDLESALTRMNLWAGKCWPLSASCHDGERLVVRLSGAEAALTSAGQGLGGERFEPGPVFWQDLREQRLGFFVGGEDLWRLSLPPHAPMPSLPGRWLVEWGGALRWLKTDQPAEHVFSAALALGGHACRFRTQLVADQVFQPLAPAIKQLHVNLKRAFDPYGLFNPRRMYEDW